jgi:hypothetical protein
LAHVALSLVKQEELRTIVESGQNVQVDEWTSSLIMDMSRQLLSNTRNRDAQLVGARILLRFFGSSEADDGIEALCDLQQWDEARAAAIACNRSADLVPRVDERFADACAEALRSLSDGLEDLKSTLEKLSVCRALQKELGIGINADDKNTRDEDEDGASAAPSVLSFVSTSSSKSSGSYSHLSRNSDIQVLTSRSSTLRLGDSIFGNEKIETKSKSITTRRKEKKIVRSRPGSQTEEKEFLDIIKTIEQVCDDERYKNLAVLNLSVNIKLAELKAALNSMNV